MGSHPGRHTRLLLQTMLAFVAALGLAVGVGGTAHAAPTAAELEKQIDDLWNKLEPVIEEHNAIRQQLAANKTRSTDLARRIQPLSLQVDLAMVQVSEIAVKVYQGGSRSALNALLSSGSPTSLADQLSLLDQVARSRQAQISNVASLRAQFEAQKAPLDQLVIQLSGAEQLLAAKQKQIEVDLKRLQDLRTQAYGSPTGGTGALKPSACPSADPGGKAGIAVTFACAQIGKPYKWGAEGPSSYDCSGLTMAAWLKAGVSLPHNAAAQRRAIPSVSKANLRPGDLVFYYSDLHHVGMYAGAGWIVHASQAGVPVKMRAMDNGSIHSYGRPG